MPTLYLWRIVAIPANDPWRRKKGQVLKHMTDEAGAAAWMRANPGAVLEKVPGSDEVKTGDGGHFKPYAD